MKIDPMRFRRIRATTTKVSERLHLRVWFPHIPLALLMLLGGALLLYGSFAGHWREYIEQMLSDQRSLSPRLLATFLIGAGMILTAIGLVFRSRLAWVITLSLVAAATVSLSLEGGGPLLAYFIVMLVVLVLSWRQFDQFSVAASTVIALSSVIMLIGYSTFGAYYLGADFDPPIADPMTALYWSMVTMSTVGYGDIIPQTGEAQLFTVSVIVFGLSVFATALTAVIAPLVGQSIARIVHHQGARVKREKHFIVIGDTFLATNTAKSLEKRGQAVTRIFRHEPNENIVEEFDTVVGNPSSEDVLLEAGVKNAEAVVTMLADDSENAFVVLAVRELAPHVQTVVAINDATHIDRIRLVHPNVLITPQALGGELAAMLLSGEPITADFVTHNIFERLNDKR